ncbi:DUF1351 domain-containing protein [Streptococcus suis]|uniref:DUF1351 domain-containing protein n=1 Tax=Streptococcus suis TaxID=1307 RepID=UPI0005D227C4|nr:DUF1351 domain-containing protein [Streptococcus suis]CYZ86578.1 phage protein [Streptococcus suis]
MQELQIIDEQKINRIYELVSTDEFTRESFEEDLKEATEKYKGYIATASTLKDDKAKRAELNKLIEAKHRIRIDTKNLLSETPNTWDEYAKSIIAPFEKVVSELDKSIKGIEEHQRTLKLDTVKSYLANKAAEYMLDPRLFDEKALEYIKASDFMADGVTLKKVTMKSLEDMVTFEYQKQQEHEKEKAAISGQCAEYGMTDQPYIRMLQSMSLADVMQQIMSDYLFEQEKQKMRQAEAEREQLLAEQQAKQQAQAQKSTETPKVDPETGEILDGGELTHSNQKTLTEAKNEPDTYNIKMGLTVFFKTVEEKDRFKETLAAAGFEHQKNYWVPEFGWIEPLKQEELKDNLKVGTVKRRGN